MTLSTLHLINFWKYDCAKNMTANITKSIEMMRWHEDGNSEKEELLEGPYDVSGFDDEDARGT